MQEAHRSSQNWFKVHLSKLLVVDIDEEQSFPFTCIVVDVKAAPPHLRPSLGRELKVSKGFKLSPIHTTVQVLVCRLHQGSQEIGVRSCCMESVTRRGSPSLARPPTNSFKPMCCSLGLVAKTWKTRRIVVFTSSRVTMISSNLKWIRYHYHTLKGLTLNWYWRMKWAKFCTILFDQNDRIPPREVH